MIHCCINLTLCCGGPPAALLHICVNADNGTFLDRATVVNAHRLRSRDIMKF